MKQDNRLDRARERQAKARSTLSSRPVLDTPSGDQKIYPWLAVLTASRAHAMLQLGNEKNRYNY